MASAFRGLGRRLRADERVAPRGREALAEYRAIAEVYRRRGDLAGMREVLQRLIPAEELVKLRSFPHREVEALSLMADCKLALGSGPGAAARGRVPRPRSSRRRAADRRPHAVESLGGARRWQPAESEQFAWLLKRFTEVKPK